MAEIEERFFVDSVVRGFHVYKDVWNPVVGEIIMCQQDFGNLHDPYAVAAVRDSVTVGHVPRTISSLCYSFLRRNGTISCQITGRRQRSVDLPQGGLEVPCALTFVGQSKDIKKVKKLVELAPAKSIEPPVAKKARVEHLVVEDDQAGESNGDEMTWLKFHGSLLTESDRMIMISSGLLNDRHIRFAQVLLHNQFPFVEGQQDTLFQRKEKHKKITCGIQIIHDRGNHWIVASTMGFGNINRSVRVYDSVHSTVSDETVCVIKNLFEFTTETKIDQVKMQRQHGSRDCGLFAIAVSTALVNALDVSQITFRQGEMRRHLKSCFIANSLIPFPYDSISPVESI